MRLFILAILLRLLVLAIGRFRLHPFLALLLTALIVGILSGHPAHEVITVLHEGFGRTVESIGLIIAFGAILGVALERSGSARTLAQFLLQRVGPKRTPLALSLSGWLIAIPVFCDAGFVLMAPLLHTLSRQTGQPVPLLAVALATGLYATHVFVPPTPGPLAATATLEADVGLVLLLGLLVSIPASDAGLLWARYYAKRVSLSAVPLETPATTAFLKPPLLAALAPLVIPVLLIALRSIVLAPHADDTQGLVPMLLRNVGHPTIALLLGVLLAMTLRAPQGEIKLHHWIAEGLRQAGSILLITGAGGALGHVLRATGIGEVLGSSLAQSSLGLWVPFLIAAALKTAQGSSTVALITTSALMAPLLPTTALISALDRAFVVLAIGAGAMTVSHLNDSYFWVVAHFSGMAAPTALRTYTLATLIQGLVSILAITALHVAFSF